MVIQLVDTRIEIGFNWKVIDAPSRHRMAPEQAGKHETKTLQTEKLHRPPDDLNRPFSHRIFRN
ncbi:hypothetical protein YTPLAS72_08440 [Nitrospira sp.]|nr:hypothetical protein YTPLAS72_08440 [Nitrospira sp.]